MRGLILKHNKDGIEIMDRNGYFYFIYGFTDLPIGTEIETPDADTSGSQEGSQGPGNPVFRLIYGKAE